MGAQLSTANQDVSKVTKAVEAPTAKAEELRTQAGELRTQLEANRAEQQEADAAKVKGEAELVAARERLAQLANLQTGQHTAAEAVPAWHGHHPERRGLACGAAGAALKTSSTAFMAGPVGNHANRLGGPATS